VLGEKLTRFIEDDGVVVADIGGALASARCWRGEVRCRRKDGALRHQDLVITPVMDGVGGLQRFVAVRRDISDRIEAERKVAALRDRLEHAERMSVLGLMAASIAHELNNPMTASLANLGLAVSEIEDLLAIVRSPDVRTRLQGLHDMIVDSLDGVDRAVRVVRDVRNFVRTEVAQLDRISPNDAMRRTARASGSISATCPPSSAIARASARWC
jgi:C4-dicarboxylate-specific signal transduction histidine kinase